MVSNIIDLTGASSNDNNVRNTKKKNVVNLTGNRSPRTRRRNRTPSPTLGAGPSRRYRSRSRSSNVRVVANRPAPSVGGSGRRWGVVDRAASPGRGAGPSRQYRSRSRSRSSNVRVVANRQAANAGWPRVQFGALRLKPHQVAVSRLLRNPTIGGALLYFKVGSGKTLAAIAAAENLARSEGRWRRVVVILPASLRSNFQKELLAAQPSRPDLFEVLSFHKVHGMTREQRATLGRDAMLVVDEVQALRNPNNKDGRRTMLDSVFEVSQTAHKRLLLSGTPVINYPYEIGSALALAEPSLATQVLKTWEIQNGVPIKSHPQFVGLFGRTAQQHPEILNGMLRCRVLFYAPSATNAAAYYPRVSEAWVDVPLSGDQLDRHVELALQIKAELMANLVRMLANPADVRNDDDDDALPRSVKFLTGPRMANLAVRGTHAKIDRAVQAITQEVARGGKCLAFSFYLRSCLRIMEQQLRRANVDVVVFDGEQPEAKRAEAVAKYNRGDIPVLLLSSAGREGLDLKDTTQIHIMEPQWNEGTVQQMIGRGVRYKSHANTSTAVRIFRYCATMPSREHVREVLRRFRIPPAEHERLLNSNYLLQYSADQFLKRLSEAKYIPTKTFLARLEQIARANERQCLGAPVR